MLEALVVLGVLWLVTVAVFAVLVQSLLAERREAEHDWRKERDRLLERIQRPERIPAPDQSTPLELSEQEPDEWHLVGQIGDISDSYGLGDDG